MDLTCLCIGGLALFILFMQQMMDVWMYEEGLMEDEKYE
tara:strand:+ start:231 stop:347 length:117 start_codon:yes stop_codon:yes gene_type:complete